MKLSTPIIQQKRIYYFIGEDVKQTAEIVFDYRNDTGVKNDGVWIFIKCDFLCTGADFELEDWEFLGAVNDKIKELLKELNK